MPQGIREQLAYRARYEEGTQHPLDTLQIGSGTCRDYAQLMIEELRRLAVAARLGSRYRVDGDNQHAGGGATHAWVQVYIPDAGWIEFDPTNGIEGTRDLVRVAVARDPSQAIPLQGNYTGPAGAYLGMEGNVTGTSVDQSERVTAEG